MKRIDALAQDHRARTAVLRGALLDETEDPVLQELVAEAARALGMPTAAVTLILEHTQFFRAHVGLGADLAALRSTDRDLSFCQFVVRDEHRFEVTNAREDARVPQALVERYGIGAYAGEPVRVAGVVVGSLCVVGGEPRSFSDEERAALATLASRTSRRLDELARTARATNRALVMRAAGPAFQEARNVLAALTADARAARVTAAEARPLAHLARAIASEPAALAVTRSADALLALDEMIADIDVAAERLVATFDALEALLAPVGARAAVADVVRAASRLAHHRTKLVGSVVWDDLPDDAEVTVPAMVATSALAAALGTIASASPGAAQIRGAVRADEGEVSVELRADDVPREALATCVEEVVALLDGDPRVRAELVDGKVVQLRFGAAR